MAGRASRFWPVGTVIERFLEQGCEIRVAEATIKLADGETLNVRYLLNPANRRFAPLVDLADDDRVSEQEVAFWERRLDVTIRKPD